MKRKILADFQICISLPLKNYRPVSILPILSKVYEKLVLQQLAVFMRGNQFTINTNQAIEKITPQQHYY